MITINRSSNTWPSESSIEIAERKGKGHPDTIMDYIVEECSKELSKYYLENFGYILHHNIDKGLLVGGKSIPKFGGGHVLEPIKILVAGRATVRIESHEIPIGEIILNSSKKWLKENIRFLDVENHVIIDYAIKPGSVDLTSIYKIGKDIPLANDTSIGVSFYPYTDLEEIVYKTEKLLNSESIKEKMPFIGEDIKVMGIREGEKIELIVAAAFIDKYISSLEEYIDKKDRIKEIIEKEVLRDYPYNFEITINAADKYEENIVYLTVTGTSGESGDDGQVGRGNRVNGLITPCRPMSMEATAGKNSRSHVGKIYNVFAKELSKKIYEEFNVKNEVIVVSRIGHPITQPAILNINIYDNYDENKIKALVKEHLTKEFFEELQKRIIEGKLELF